MILLLHFKDKTMSIAKKHGIKTGKPKKALRMYQNGFSMNAIDFITKDLMLDKADKLKQDFGW